MHLYNYDRPTLVFHGMIIALNIPGDALIQFN